MTDKTECKTDKTGLSSLGLFIAIGLIGCGYFIGNTLYKSRVSVNTASVKGLAEMVVKSDLAIWDISYTMQSSTLDGAYAAANGKKAVVRDFLMSKNFSPEELSFNDDVYIQEYRDNGVLKDKLYKVTVYVKVRTEAVEKVGAARADIGELIAKGVAVSNNAPRYLFTKLNDVKPKMLEEATKNAQVAAKQFAENAGASVGTIQSASQGAFNISAVDEVDGYGTDTSSLEKKIRVVTTISFYLD